VARSSRRFDLGGKLRDYERTRVLEYVVVALDPDEVFWHDLRNSRLVRVSPSAHGAYRSIAFPGLWLNPEALLSRDLDALIATLEQGLASPEHEQFAPRMRGTPP
jgi:hypothetical protein